MRRRLIAIAVLLCCLNCASWALGQAKQEGRDWSQFRGPGGLGRSDAKGVPLNWSSTENIAWKAELPGPGASSPIVLGDRIYLTCYTGYFVPGQSGGSLEQLKRHLIALRRNDGGIVWDRAIAAKLPEESEIRDHGFAANTPAADADQVYAFLGKSGVFAFNHSGEQQWQADVGSKTSGWGTSASPVLYKDSVFINAGVESESLIALDRRTGVEKWRAKGIREAWNTPVVITASSGRQELVVTTQGSVLAFDPETGKSLWSCSTDIGWYMVPSVVADNGIVYCLGGRSGTAALAVRAGGSGDVTETHTDCGRASKDQTFRLLCTLTGISTGCTSSWESPIAPKPTAAKSFMKSASIMEDRFTRRRCWPTGEYIISRARVACSCWPPGRNSNSSRRMS